MVLWVAAPRCIAQPSRDIPPQEQAADPQVRSLLESAVKLSEQGDYTASFQQLRNGLDLTIARGLLSDRAILEAKLGASYLLRGNVPGAREQWRNAYSDAVKTDNLVLQADVLVSISSTSQLLDASEDTRDLATQAVETARKSGNHWIESRALGELARIQLAIGRVKESRISIEEALLIDRSNQYRGEALHTLYLAWIIVANDKSSLDEAVGIAVSARQLAVKYEDYLTFMMASTWLGQRYIQEGKIAQGVALLEHTRGGVSEEGHALFKNSAGYEAAMSLPLPKIVLFASIAQAYTATQRPDDALNCWKELSDVAKASGFLFAQAGAMHEMAAIYRARKNTDTAISYYSQAAALWAAAGNTPRQIIDLSSEAALLFQTGRNPEVLKLDEQILPLAKSTKDVERQFITDLAIAEILQPRGDLDGTAKALLDAESLVPPDLMVQSSQDTFLLELYARLADLYAKKNEPVMQLVALEKALTPAERIGVQKTAALDKMIKVQLAAINLQDVGEKVYRSQDFVAALTDYELLQHFEEFEARQAGTTAKYFKDPENQNLQNLLGLPFKIIAQPDGATTLASNLQQMGPVAQMVKLPILQVLSGYYMLHQKPELADKFATAALPLLKLGNQEQPNLWDGQIVCTLASALFFEKKIDDAINRTETCLQVAKKVNDPRLLLFANQINVWTLEAAGKHDQANISSQYLLQHTPDDPLLYVQQAAIDAQQGNREAANAAYEQALHLYEVKNNLSGMASVHLFLANALNLTHTHNAGEELSHAQAALAIYSRLKDSEGQAEANLALARCFTADQNQGKALDYFSAALKLSREAKSPNLEASIQAETGQAYVAFNNPVKALECYRKSIDIYDSVNDRGNEGLVLKAEASVLANQDKTDEALTIALKAQRLADASGAWYPRFSVRLLLALLYGNQGEYEKCIASLRKAKTISDAVGQTQSSALADLDLSNWLLTAGDSEEALKSANEALPFFKASNDVAGEISAYFRLIEIFGARESDLKDFDKALQYYTLAQQLVDSDVDRASLALEIYEIYWQEGRFKQAIEETSTALTYYEKTHDEWGQASALISMAEAQRSAGNVDAAATTLAKAEPLVTHLHDFYMTGRLYYGQAGLLKKERNYRAAIDKYVSVIELLERFKAGSDTNLQRQAAESYGFIYDDLADSYYQLGIADKQSQLFAANGAIQYSELNKSRLFTNTWGRTFIDVLRRRLPSQLQETERTLSLRKQQLETELDRAMSGQGERSAKQVQEDLGRLAEEQSALENQIRDVSPAYAGARYPTPVTIAGLPLREGEFFIEFKMLDDGLLVWVVKGSTGSPNLVAFYKVDRARQWFADRILAIRDSFNRGDPDEFDPHISEELFKAIFPEPIAASVVAAPSIIFVPDDVLFLLPFEILSPNATTSSFVFLKTATSYFPSAAAFRLARDNEKAVTAWPEQFFGVADPVTSKDDPRYSAASLLSQLAPTTQQDRRESGSSTRGESVDSESRENTEVSMGELKTRGYFFSRLPQTSVEVKSIAALFPPSEATVRTGLDATKSELLETDLGRFRFVHFATHGFIPVEPGMTEPSLILSYDGGGDESMMLGLSQILQFKLHAELVVLSACNTGSGKVTRAEGVASLGTAFLAAGASSTVMSLWKVSDASTSVLMQEFYRNLLQGMPKRSALAAARSALISRGYSNPFFWAPFILTGD